MKFKFQSYFDIQTRADSLQVIQWKVGGTEVINRCRHLFGAYKYFKLGKISVKMVPASTLPVDPLGLSYGDSDPQTVDPRDQMNPGLVRITNGEDVFTDVSLLNENQQRRVYEAMMLDPRWSKFMLQSGFRRSAFPMYWQVGQLSQDKYPGATDNLPIDSADSDGVFGTNNKSTAVRRFIEEAQSPNNTPYTTCTGLQGSSARGLFQVGHKGRLGYLPTDYYQDLPIRTSDGVRGIVHSYGFNNVPEVSVITCVLPRAYKTLYYYRVFVTEEVFFTGLRASPYDSGYSGIDQFLIGQPTPVNPHNGYAAPSGSGTGNNGGDLP